MPEKIRLYLEEEELKVLLFAPNKAKQVTANLAMQYLRWIQRKGKEEKQLKEWSNGLQGKEKE